MPKYLMLIVENEAAYAEAGEAAFGEVMGQHNAFAQEVTDAGATLLGGEALQPTATATHVDHAGKAAEVNRGGDRLIADLPGAIQPPLTHIRTGVLP